MIPVDQIRDFEWGDCLRACVASILELKLEEVPDFIHENGPRWFTQLQVWLLKRGKYPVYVSTTASIISHVYPHALHWIGVSTRDYKNQATQALLKKYPKIRRVHFWEDRKNHLTDFQQTTEALGYKFVPRHVDEAPSKGVWKDFLRVFYESGAMMVPNTNTESRDIHPKVRVDYLLKTDPNFRRSLEKRLRTWTSMGRPGIKKTSATTRAILRLARTHQELRQRLIEAFLRERAKGAV